MFHSQSSSMKRIGLGAAASLVAFALAGSAAATNLVVNGSFESPVISPPYSIDATATGWTGTGDLVVQGYGGSLSSGAGNQWWDLNPDVSAGTGISQDVSLVAGKTYKFSFLYDGGGGGSTTMISYTVGGDLSGSVSTAALDVYHGSPWQTLSTTFVSSVTGLETLHFKPNGTWSGGFIDDVQLATAAAGVPEPSAWIMMLIGFGAIGAGIRKARQKSGAATILLS